MKIFLLIFWIISSIISKSKYNRQCKTEILRSFGFTSRVTPDKLNSLCPRITMNCCTYHDQLTMHKIWSTEQKSALKERYETMIDHFALVNQIISIKDDIALIQYTKNFEKTAQPEPTKFLINHLEKIAADFNNDGMTFYMSVFKGLKDKGLPGLYKEVQKLRESVLCMVCDWHNHNFINLESLTITYKINFCQKLAGNLLPVLYDKYNIVVKMILNFDEWIYLVSGRRLIESHTDRATLRRYILIIDKCKQNTQKIDNCAEFCKQFNVNKFTYMFDGEEELFQQIAENFKNFLEDYEESPQKVYAERKDTWTMKSLKKFQDNDSVVSTKITKDPNDKAKETNSYKLKFNSQSNTKYYDNGHNLVPTQIEKLDDISENAILFRQQGDPIDLSSLIIVFQRYYGVNLYDESKDMNLSLPKDKIISLIEKKKSLEKSLNEYIEDSARAILDTIKVENIQDWFTDKDMKFKHYSPFVEPKIKIESNAYLFFTSLFVFVFLFFY
jgi:hypothetical protein